LSFFKLINILEEGTAGITFSLIAQGNNTEVSIINEVEDHELQMKYWEWKSKYGR
jgi:hypothetical protein